MEDPTVGISLEESPKTDTNKVYCPNYNRSEATLTDNYHQRILEKSSRLNFLFRISLNIQITIIRTTWSSVILTNGWSAPTCMRKWNIRISPRIEKASFINIHRYQGIKLADKTICAATEGDNISCLKVAIQL